MRSFDAALWGWLTAAAALAGGACALVAWWLGAPMSCAWLPPLAAFATAGVIGAAAHRQSNLARGALEGPSFGHVCRWRAGLYGSLINESLALLRQHRAAAERAERAQTECEARIHARRKEIRRLQAALNCLDQPVLVLDGTGKALFANPAMRRMVGYECASDVCGEELPPLDSALVALPELHALLSETQRRGAAETRRHAELTVSQDGEEIQWRATATNVEDADGTLLGTVAVLTDIRDECRERTRYAAFVSSVAHEMKTPLASMKAFLELLLDGDVDNPEEQQELHGFLDVQVDRLTRMVNDVLNLARIESGVIKIQREDCDLNEVLTRALETVAPMAEEKQMHLISELSELYLPVHVDQDLFGQAVINLLSNAVKYTPEGGEVRLRSRMEDQEAIVEVRDTGLGIPEDSLKHIFERFYRVPENNSAAPGTGLGLALVHDIVTGIHAGRIDVESVVGEGTCFTIRIPLGHRQQNARKKSERLVRAAAVR